MINFNKKIIPKYFSVSGHSAPEKNCPPGRVGVWVKVSVSFRVDGQPDN